MRILVTGASSLMGQLVVSGLLERGDSVHTFQRNAHGAQVTAGPSSQEFLGSVADPWAVRNAVERCDAVIHLAARVGITGTPSQFHETNVRGTQVVLAEAKAAGVSRFVHISSPSVAHSGAALVGATAGKADPSLTQGMYATTKAKAELIALAENSADFAVVVLRPHLVWGPGDTQLVGRIIERARQGRLAHVGSGAALVDSTYVSNAADAIIAAVDRAADAAGEPLVVSNGEPRPIGDLVDAILAAHGMDPPRLRVPKSFASAAGWLAEMAWDRFDMEGEPPMTTFIANQMATAHWFDQRRTQELLQWQPRVSIEEGLSLLAASASK